MIVQTKARTAPLPSRMRLHGTGTELRQSATTVNTGVPQRSEYHLVVPNRFSVITEEDSAGAGYGDMPRRTAASVGVSTNTHKRRQVNQARMSRQRHIAPSPARVILVFPQGKPD